MNLNSPNQEAHAPTLKAKFLREMAGCFEAASAAGLTCGCGPLLPAWLLAFMAACTINWQESFQVRCKNAVVTRVQR